MSVMVIKSVGFFVSMARWWQVCVAWCVRYAKFKNVQYFLFGFSAHQQVSEQEVGEEYQDAAYDY